MGERELVHDVRAAVGVDGRFRVLHVPFPNVRLAVRQQALE
jgi:hypothetical protein